MLTLEARAKKISEEIGRRFLNITVASRKEIQRLIVREVQPLCIQQRQIRFSDHEKRLSPQCQKILDLLNDRRSQGATNSELVDIGFNYRARVSELRQRGYKIDCEDIGDGLTIYRLHPTDWKMK